MAEMRTRSELRAHGPARYSGHSTACTVIRATRRVEGNVYTCGRRRRSLAELPLVEATGVVGADAEQR